MLLGASLLRRGRVGQLAALLRQLRRNGIPWPTILRKTFSPWIPPAIHRGMRRIAGRVSGDLFESSPILPQLAQSTGILNRVRSSGVGLDAVSRGNSRIHRMTGYHRFDHGYARKACFDGSDSSRPARPQTGGLSNFAFRFPKNSSCGAGSRGR